MASRTRVINRKSLPFKARRLRPRFFKNTHNFVLQFPKLHGEDDAARMKDEVDARRQQVDMAAQGFAHTALNAVALVRFADDFADGEPDARSGSAGRGVDWLRREEPARGCRLAFARCRVGPYIVCMLAQPKTGQRLAPSRVGS